MVNDESKTGDAGTELRAPAEALERTETKEIEVTAPDEVSGPAHELPANQIELEIQNEELPTAQQELIAARDRYKDLYDYAPVGYATLNHKGRILEANLTLADLLGAERYSLVDMAFSRFVVPEDQSVYYLHLHALRHPGAVDRCELRISPIDRAPLWVGLDIVVKKAEKGQIRHLIAVSNISALKRAEENLTVTLREKDTLLKENRHRVTNNLQVVESLLRLHIENTDCEKDADILRSAVFRVHNMALIDGKLHQAHDLADIDFSSFVTDLVDDVFASHHLDRSRIAVAISIKGIRLGIDVVIPCAQIITELFSNSIKHAFPAGRSGTIGVTLRRLDQDRVELTVSDDGVGLPDGVDWKAPTTLGLWLVKTFSQQVGGEITLDRAQGTSYRLIFKVG